MAEHRVVVEVDFAVEREQLAVAWSSVMNGLISISVESVSMKAL